jgi:ATP adenylyltransferase
MSNTTLHAPWRMEYIRSLEKSNDPTSCGCFLCDATGTFDRPEERKRRLVLWKSEKCVCLINRFPYTSGHLLVAPSAHVADLADMDDATLLDLNKQTVRAAELLKRAMNPQGFNIGINMGSAAGAGVPGHLHQHIVARWAGDVNFMSVVGEVRIIPNAMATLWEQLMAVLESSK